MLAAGFQQGCCALATAASYCGILSHFRTRPMPPKEIVVVARVVIPTGDLPAFVVTLITPVRIVIG
jgi:hypothetical protein